MIPPPSSLLPPLSSLLSPLSSSPLITPVQRGLGADSRPQCPALRLCSSRLWASLSSHLGGSPSVPTRTGCLSLPESSEPLTHSHTHSHTHKGGDERCGRVSLFFAPKDLSHLFYYFFFLFLQRVFVCGRRGCGCVSTDRLLLLSVRVFSFFLLLLSCPSSDTEMDQITKERDEVGEEEEGEEGARAGGTTFSSSSSFWT